MNCATLLQGVNRRASMPRTLRGRVELRTDVEAHRLADKSHAIRSCDNCHRYGAEPFQNVTVSVTGPDGRPVRYPAHKDILGSALAVQSLPEFYAIGGTRSRILDALLVLALLAGIGIPAGHMTMKWLFRKYRARRAGSGGGNDAGKGNDGMQRIYVHPLPVRIWHWINALGFVALILTGVQIRYMDLISVMSFKTAINLHNWIGFVLIANFFVWLLFYLFLRQDPRLSPRAQPDEAFPRRLRQMQYYGYGIFRGDPNPHHVSAYHKFNPLQSMLYQVIMLLIVPLQFFTGLLLWDLKHFAGAVEFFGGVRVVATVHVLCFIFFVGFILVHLYLASLGHTPTAHFKAMITGYEEVEKESGNRSGVRGFAGGAHLTPGRRVMLLVDFLYQQAIGRDGPPEVDRDANPLRVVARLEPARARADDAGFDTAGRPQHAAAAHVAAHEEAIVRELRDLVALPNVADNHDDIRRNAAALVAMLEKRGIATRILETPGAPVAVFGDLKTPGAKQDAPFLRALRRPAGRAAGTLGDAGVRADAARGQARGRRADRRLGRREISAAGRVPHLCARVERRQGTDRRDAGGDRRPARREHPAVREPQVLPRGRGRGGLAESRAHARDAPRPAAVGSVGLRRRADRSARRRRAYRSACAASSASG